MKEVLFHIRLKYCPVLPIMKNVLKMVNRTDPILRRLIWVYVICKWFFLNWMHKCIYHVPEKLRTLNFRQTKPLASSIYYVSHKQTSLRSTNICTTVALCKHFGMLERRRKRKAFGKLYYSKPLKNQQTKRSNGKKETDISNQMQQH